MPFEDSPRLSLDALINRNGEPSNIEVDPSAEDVGLTNSAWASGSSATPSSSSSSNERYASPSALLESDGRILKGRGTRGSRRAKPEYCAGREPSESRTSGHHPLRSVGLRTSFNEYSGITRPTLSRMLGSADAINETATPEGSLISGLDLATPVEKVVLVHEISPKDSLAGVALKYGLTIAELRKTNHLWASDSIHIRKVLYIPLDEASIPASTFTSDSNSPIQRDSYSHSPPHSPPHSHSYSHASLSKSHERYSTTNGNSHNGSTIRRIPVSQLSFFPPPSKPSALAPRLPSDDILSGAFTTKLTRHPATLPRTFTSIFTALPIVARLSFDSTSSTTSDEQEHELDDVRAAGHSWETPTTPKKSENLETPFSHSHSHLRHRKSYRQEVRTPSHGNYPPGDIPVSHRSSWTEAEPVRVHTAVRSVQLEPSPGMQLPRRTRSASVGAGSAT